MRRQRNFFVITIITAAVATPVLAQTVATGDGSGTGKTHGAASIPDFTGAWRHPSFPWFEPPASGSGPVTNRSRWPQRPGNDGPPLPPGVEGVSDYDQLV